MSAQPVEIRMARLEGAYEQINERLGTMEARIDNRFNGIEARLNNHDARFDALDRKIDSRFGQLLVVVMTSWVTTIGAILLRH